MLKIVARRFTENCERVEILPGEQRCFQPNHSTTAKRFVVDDGSWHGRNCRRALSISTKETTPSTEHSCGIYSPASAYRKYSFGTRQYHKGMRPCVRLEDDEFPGWFNVEQGFRQGCELAPLLFKMFTAVIHLALTCFEADKEVMDALVSLNEGTGAGEPGVATDGDPASATSLWATLYGLSSSHT